MGREASSPLSVPLVPVPDWPNSGPPEKGMDRQPHTNYEPFSDGRSEADPAELPSTSYSHAELEMPSLPRHRGLRWVYSKLFRKSTELEEASVNHQYTRAERERLSNVESIDYLPPNSEVFRKWLSSQPHGRQWDRWFMMGCIGVTVGVICYLLKTFIEIFARIKYISVRWLIQHANLFVAWLFNIVYSLALVFISTWSVVTIAPQAAGAGVAEVMAYLNGCQLPKVFNVQTLWVKFLSCATAVGSGLPVGPEGPMVHIGAMVGAALSQGHSTTLGFSTGLFKRFQNPKDKRDFVTAGTAVGIATAFGAPIGGLLFAMEELATNSFSQALGWQIFFACMLAVWTVDTFRSAQIALVKGQFGSFDGDAGTVLFEVQTQLTNHVAAMAPAAIIGLICGLLAIAFTSVNLKAARLREAVLTRSNLLRMAEPCIIIAVFVSLGMLLPLAFPCTRTSCVMREGEDDPVCPPGVTSHVRRVVEESLELYTCKASGPDTEFPAEGSRNITVPSSYNELATLMSVPGEDAIRHLLSRGTHREFGYGALLVMLVYYFGGAVWAAGSAIASGLFVPMLLIGSCIGRIVGLVAIDIAAKHGWGSGEVAPPGVFYPPSPWSWIDPGAFALIGAASFMGGVTRLTISITVIMMEVSADVRMLLPLLVGILVAKWIADAGTHSLYHGLLEVKCVPWLPFAPASSKSLDLIPIQQTMAAPVTVLPEKVTPSELREVLRGTSHNGFPVVRPSPGGQYFVPDRRVPQVFVGLVTRDNLLVLLRRISGMGPPLSGSDEVTYEELNQQHVSAAARSLVSQQQHAALQGHTAANGTSYEGPTEPAYDQPLDLTAYVNTSAVTVLEYFSIERAYLIFRSMGLRHLTVVDDQNRVKGIVTRKDLMGYKLDEAVQRADGLRSNETVL